MKKLGTFILACAALTNFIKVFITDHHIKFENRSFIDIALLVIMLLNISFTFSLNFIGRKISYRTLLLEACSARELLA